MVKIQDGEVYAKSNQKDDMVEFYERKKSPNQYNDNQTLDYLDKSLSQAITLIKRYSDLSANKKVLDMVVDDTRNILYVLLEQGTIKVKHYFSNLPAQG